MAHKHKRQRQPRIMRNEPVLTVMLVVLAFFVISGGVGLTLLIAGQNQRSATLQVTPTSKPAYPSGLSPQQLYARIISSPPAIIDSLTHPDMLLWTSSKTGNLSGCTFSKQGLVLESGNNYVSGCLAPTSNLSDFAYQIKVIVLKGSEGGMSFRFGSQNESDFIVSQGGTFSLLTFGNPLNILLHRTDPAIKVGAGQSNILTLIAQGQTFLLYANGHYLGQVTSNKIPASGPIGLVAYAANDPSGKHNDSTIIFSDMRVWTL